ncbi:MAG: 2-oxoacid:acceptor oxidoreductase family protein [Candidatus Aenigmarchaeota archaeon]|nr:2-oxoacid:acceptor oxidoreductase family protein [Candidatus Aenigmarchaeota archaeon]
MNIVIIGYKGQGVKTAARTISRAAMFAGMFSQDFYESGNIVKAYVRLDKEPLLEKGPIQSPDIMILLDQSLFSAKAAKDNIVYIINSTDKNLVKKNIHILNASEIAFATTGKAIPNTPMLGALSKYVQKIQTKHLKQALDIELPRKQKEHASAIEEGLKLVK